jgi:hypothetical protein
VQVHVKNLEKENELLIMKLADMTIDNEKIVFENSEYQLKIEALNEQCQALRQELESLEVLIFFPFFCFFV